MPTEEETRARPGLFVARRARPCLSIRRYLSERDIFSSVAFPPAVKKALRASNLAGCFHACLRRKFRLPYGVRPLANGCCANSLEAERHDGSRHSRRIAGYDWLTDERMPSLGTGRREGLDDGTGKGYLPDLTQNSSAVSEDHPD